MKVTITKIAQKQIEVELPEKCPACERDFTDEGLLEYGYQPMEWGARIESGEVVGNDERDDQDGWQRLVTGYYCRCGRQLATTE